MTLNRITLRSAQRTLSAAVLGTALVAGMMGCGSDPTGRAGASGQTSRGAAELDGTSLPPWSLPTDMPAQTASAGLDLGPMGMAEHYHPQLRIIIHGQDVPVAAGIGVDSATGAMSAVHTHEGDGTIHIEAAKSGDVFTLGQVFTQWGVKLTRTQIGGVRAKAGRAITVTSNGSPATGDPNELRLRPHQKIVVRLP